LLLNYIQRSRLESRASQNVSSDVGADRDYSGVITVYSPRVANGQAKMVSENLIFNDSGQISVAEVFHGVAERMLIVVTTYIHGMLPSGSLNTDVQYLCLDDAP